MDVDHPATSSRSRSSSPTQRQLSSTRRRHPATDQTDPRMATENINVFGREFMRNPTLQSPTASPPRKRRYCPGLTSPPYAADDQGISPAGPMVPEVEIFCNQFMDNRFVPLGVRPPMAPISQPIFQMPNFPIQQPHFPIQQPQLPIQQPPALVQQQQALFQDDAVSSLNMAPPGIPEMTYVASSHEQLSYVPYGMFYISTDNESSDESDQRETSNEDINLRSENSFSLSPTQANKRLKSSSSESDHQSPSLPPICQPTAPPRMENRSPPRSPTRNLPPAARPKLVARRRLKK